MMETIYNWLLQSMGNEGNAYTILNCRRTQRAEGGAYIQVMARSKDFRSIDMLIANTQLTEAETTALTGGSNEVSRCTLAGPNEVIEYVKTGELTDASASAQDDAIYLILFKPVGIAGELTFPPEQSN